MTAKEAKLLLATAPRATDKKARLNPALSQLQAVVIVENCIKEKPDDEILDHLFEKRVLQVTLNQKRPRF
jgi:hypothetical protein